MFSRNNNTQENYTMEQKRNQKLRDYRFFENSPNGPAFTTHIQGNGLGIAKLHPKDLSDNYIDVDSFLKGIGSCNFIESPKLQYNHKQNGFLHIDQRQPILLPTPFISYPPQRPGFT
jgi:hypothetical protein